MLLLVNLVSLITFCCFCGAFFFSLLWWFLATIFVRLRERYTHHVFWFLILVSGLLYLWRMACRSFWLHGRRPNSIFLGFFQPGETFEWKHGIYEPGLRVTHRLALYHDWWVHLQNPILVDSWIEEQNQTLFFRWGSFFRYWFLSLFLGFRWVVGQGRRLAFNLLGSELGHLFLVFGYLLFLGSLQFFSLLFWWIHQWWSRVLYALGGEFYLLLFFRHFYLDPLVRYQWYQKGNVDSNDSPEEVHQRPLGLRTLQGLWYGFRRFQKRCLFLRPVAGGFLSLLAFLFFSLLLLPLLVFGSLSFSLLWLFSQSHRWTYVFARKNFHSLTAFSFQKGAMSFLWAQFSLLFAFGGFLSALPGFFVYALLSLWKTCCRWGFFVLVVLCLVLLSYGSWQELFRFSFGFIFWEFFQQLFHCFFPPAPRLPFMSFHLLVDAATANQEQWFDDLRDLQGTSVYGASLCGVPLEKTPQRGVQWWDQVSNSGWWKLPLIQGGSVDRGQQFLWDFHRILLGAFYSAKSQQARYEQLYAEWWLLLFDWTNWTDLLWYIPVDGLSYAVLTRYYTFLYKGLCPHPSYYWFYLACYRWSYAWSCFWCTFGFLSFVWPARAVLMFLRSFCEQFWVILSLVGFLGRSLSVGWHGLCRLGSIIFSLLPGGLFLFVQFLGLVWRFLSFLFSLLVQGLFCLWTPSWLNLGNHRWDFSQVLWAFYGRWFFWLVSIVYWEFSQFSLWGALGPVFWSLPSWGIPDLPWVFGEGQTFFSLWSFAISFYVALQSLMDSFCLYLQFPRHLDDHSLFFKYRRIRRALMFAKEYSMISKGALFTGHRWALSPVILFRYASGEPLALATDIPFLLVDGHRAFTFVGPLFYFVALLFFLGTFRGAASFLLLRPEDKGFPTTTSIYSRQWVWDHYRHRKTSGSLDQLEKIYMFPPALLLVEAGTVFEGPEHPEARALLRRGENLFLNSERRRLPAPRFLNRRLRRQGSLGGGKSFFLDLLLSRKGFVLPFGEYLLSPRYEFLRHNFLHFGDRFLLFIAYYYSQDPWIPLCWHSYDDGDYTSWLPDLSGQLAEDLLKTGNSLRRLFQRTNARLFQDNLGEWLWSKDCGSFLLQKVTETEVWGTLAYEVEDSDFDGFVPWAPIYWLAVFPLFLFLNYYVHLENPWVDEPLITGAGSSEIRRQLLCDHNIFGHFFFCYQQFEMRGWDLIPAEDRMDTPLTDPSTLPTTGYDGQWAYGYSTAFYPVSIHWPYVSSRWTLFLGTWKPQGLLEEYWFFRLFVFIFLLVAFGGALSRPSVVSAAAPVIISKDRWSTVHRYLRAAKSFYLWFWK